MIDLNQFCGISELRPWMRAPFSIGKYTYATDGAIMVRVPLMADVPESSVPKLPAHLDKIFAGIEDLAFSAPAAMVVPLDVEVAEEVECDICDGRGKEHECPSCDCVCDNCGGSGIEKKLDKISTDFMGRVYRLRYVREILALPCEVAPRSESGDENAPLKFRFDGGFGVLLPLRKPYQLHATLKAAA